MTLLHAVPFRGYVLGEAPPPRDKSQVMAEMMFRICKAFRAFMKSHQKEEIKKRIYYPLRGYMWIDDDSLLETNKDLLDQVCGNEGAEIYSAIEDLKDRFDFIDVIMADLKAEGIVGTITVAQKSNNQIFWSVGKLNVLRKKISDRLRHKAFLYFLRWDLPSFLVLHIPPIVHLRINPLCILVQLPLWRSQRSA